jgi:hypothetical protein
VHDASHPQGAETVTDERCLSSCEILPRVLKRCQAEGAHESHYWIEATRADGRRIVARWSGPDAARPDELIEEVAPPAPPRPPCAECGGQGVIKRELGAGGRMLVPCYFCDGPGTPP